MTYSYELKFTVPFHDVDAMRIVWHGNYLKYFDQVRFALFDHAGINMYQYMLDKHYVFPITKTSTKYIAPLQPNDEFVCKASVVEARNKISMEFEIRRLTDGTICARGSSDQVAVAMPNRQLELEIPKDIRTALGFD